MVKSLFSGVSGLKTHQQRMDVIGNNIANVNTDGFKTYVTSFADIYYQTKKSPTGATATLGGSNPRQIGYGVKMNTTTQNMGASGFKYSDSNYDLALDGEGFFQVMDGAGNIFYTRAGNFSVDDYGYLVTAGGYHVLGVSGNCDGQPADSEIIRLVVPDTHAKASSATKKINGVNCTVSVSAPSDVSDMSVTFTHSEFPFATYSEGVLNIFMNMDEQIDSAVIFQQRIDEAIAAGGVTLPDELSLKFEFEAVPSDTTAKTAENSSPDWTYTLVKPQGNKYTSFGVKVTPGADGAAPTYDIDEKGADGFTDATFDVAFSGGTGDSIPGGISFAKADDFDTQLDVAKEVDGAKTYYPVKAVYSPPTGTGDAATPAKWTFYYDPNADSITQKDISAAIARARTENDEWPTLSCDKFSFKCKDVILTPALLDAVLAADVSKDALTVEMREGTPTPFSFSAKAGAPGAEANNYKITFAYASGVNNTRAVWEENTLTITICDNTTQDEINELIKKAANGDEMRTLEISDMVGIPKDEAAIEAGTVYVMNAAERKALFEKNPSMALTGGDDSFFTETAKCLTTFNVTDGRLGSEQSYKNLEDISIGTDGVIIGKHAVHGTIVLGRIDIATFDNPNGLDAAGSTMFRATEASGEAEVNIPGQNGAAEVVSGAVEMSNVDLADEFTNMIATQRGYQANSRVVTTSDTMLEELLSLKR